MLTISRKQVALEQMDILFGGQDHVEKGAHIMDVEQPHVEGRSLGKGGNTDEIREVENVSYEIRDK